MGEDLARICPKCGASDWTTRNRCNPCDAAKARAKWAADPETARAKDRERHRRWRKANPDKVREQRLRALYGVDAADIELRLVAQGMRCAICKNPKPDCVDHSHETGRVRGVLCRPCNVALGQFRDDPSLLLAAAHYVEEEREER